MKNYIGLLSIVIFGIFIFYSAAAGSFLGNDSLVTKKTDTIQKTYFKPVALTIPKIAVDVVIEEVGRDTDGRMAVPIDPIKAGWWKFGAKAGEKGSLVLAGHVDTREGKKGIFADLDKLNVGDSIEVIDELGTQFIYLVYEKQLYEDILFPIDIVFGKSEYQNLNLITCWGNYDRIQNNYDKRLVVFSKLVEHE